MTYHCCLSPRRKMHRFVISRLWVFLITVTGWNLEQLQSRVHLGSCQASHGLEGMRDSGRPHSKTKSFNTIPVFLWNASLACPRSLSDLLLFWTNFPVKRSSRLALWRAIAEGKRSSKGKFMLFSAYNFCVLNFHGLLKPNSFEAKTWLLPMWRFPR